MTTQPSYMPADLRQPLVELSIGDLLRTAAAECPDRTFLVDGVADASRRTRMSYAQVLREAERVAVFLGDRFDPRENLAIWAPNSLEWVILQFGAALAGIPLVMINPALRRDELRYVLAQSRSVGLFLTHSHRDNAMSEMVDDIRCDLPDLRETFLLENLADYGVAGNERALKPVDPRHPAMIQYTSGTTGSPKGAVLLHFGVVNNAQFVNARLGLPLHSIWLLSVPMFHTGGSVYHLLGSLWNRGVLIVMRQFDPGLLIDLVEQEQVNYFSTVPTGHLRIVEHPDFSSARVSSLIGVGSGGATVPEELVIRLEREYGAGYVVTFGQTETSASVTHTRLNDRTDQKALTVGYPLPHIELKLIDAASQIVPRGTSGEICVRGFCVLREFFDMPEQSANSIGADGWLRTGDLGILGDDGYLKITGRLKDMIIRGGENIFPREIEDVLSAHPAVAESAVLGIPDREWGEQVGAAVRLNAGEAATAEELATFLGSRIARHKVPRHWRFVDDFPQTPSGKIRKFILKDLFA